MKEKIGKTVLIIALLLVSPLFIVKAQSNPIVSIVPAMNTFNTGTTPVNSTFTINATVTNVTNLWLWQVKLTFNASMLNCVNASLLPGIFDFTMDSPVIINNTVGYVMLGSSRFYGQPGVNGSGPLVNITLKMISQPAPWSSSACDLVLDPSSTYLYNSSMSRIPATLQNGYYEYTWTPLYPFPFIEVRPSSYYAAELGEDVAVEVWVGNVSAEYRIVGFQFILRFNATLLETVSLDNGTFLEAFVNAGESLSYTESSGYMGDPALPSGYDAWVVSAAIMPDSNSTYHEPFPSGEGLLVTLHFNATLATSHSHVALTDLNFTNLVCDPLNFTDDLKCHAMDQSGNEIPFAHLYGGIYRAPYGQHDVAVTCVALAKAVVGQGYTIGINATVQNKGGYQETFNVTLYANTTAVAVETVTLAGGNSAKVAFVWNTSGFGISNYTIKAVADTVSEETSTEDNTFIDGTVYVGIPGDVNVDGKVDMIDIGTVCMAYGSSPGHPKWNPNADINGDGKVDMVDIGTACMHYGEHYP